MGVVKDMIDGRASISRTFIIDGMKGGPPSNVMIDGMASISRTFITDGIKGGIPPTFIGDKLINDVNAPLIFIDIGDIPIAGIFMGVIDIGGMFIGVIDILEGILIGDIPIKILEGTELILPTSRHGNTIGGILYLLGSGEKGVINIGGISGGGGMGISKGVMTAVTTGSIEAVLSVGVKVTEHLSLKIVKTGSGVEFGEYV